MEKLNIIIPVLNEAKNVLTITNQIVYNADKYGVPYHIYFIDDYSTDSETLKNLETIDKKEMVTVLKNKRNRGQQNAILYGFYNLSIEKLNADYICTIDCDMQDPVDALFLMYLELVKNKDKYNAAIGIRNSRDDAFLKKAMSALYYKIQSFIIGKNVPNASNFFILKANFVNLLDIENLSGSILLKLHPMLYKYDRKKRTQGQTKYSFCKLFLLAYKGIKWSMKWRFSYGRKK